MTKKTKEKDTDKVGKQGTGTAESGTGNGLGCAKSGTGNLGCTEGSPPTTITNSAGIPVPARVPEHGYGMLMSGNPGCKTSGQPKKLTRESLTDAAGEAAEDYREARNGWMTLAKEHRLAGDLHKAELCQKRADAIQDSYLRFGIGSKVTNVIDNDQALDVFEQAMTGAGLDADTQVAILERVREHLKP